MNFDELNEIIAKETGMDICPICSTPYKRRNANQKTCGESECKREWKNKYLRDLRRRSLEENPEAFRAYRREAQRKYRHKIRDREEADARFEELRDYWQKREEAVIAVKDGMTYAERQVAKTLALVPKIDVNIGKERKR